jgi:uncharacterized membrane protein
MASPDQERLDAISESVVRMIKRQDELESRVRQLESAALLKAAPQAATSGPSVQLAHPPPLPKPEFAAQPGSSGSLGLGPQATPAVTPPSPSPIPLPTQADAIAAPPSGAAPPPMPPLVDAPRLEAKPRLKTQPELETQVGLNWINRIAVVTLIFAAAFFFRYAVDAGWIGPATRVALGIAAAIVSLFFGDRMWRRGHAIFAQGLMGLGIALLYLSFYASSVLYALLPQSAAFSLMALTTVASGLMGLQYNSQAIAMLALLGGYLTPVLLSTGEDHPWFLFGYTFILNVGGLALTRARRWQWTEYLSLTATVILYSGWYAKWFGDADLAPAVTFAIAFYAQFAVAQARGIAFAAQLLAAIAAIAIEGQSSRVLFLTLVFAAGGLAVAEFRRWRETPPWTLACFCLPYGWFVAGFSGPIHILFSREFTFGLLSLGFVLFFLWVPWWAVLCGRSIRSTDLAMMVANAVAYFIASYRLLDHDYHQYMGLFTVAIAVVHVGTAKLLSNREQKEPSVLAVGVSLGFLTLAIPIQLDGFRITIAWALQASALAWLAARYKNERLNFTSWAIFALVLVRLFAFDAWIVSGAFGLRFLTFTVSAVGLWLAARFAQAELPAAVPYVGGHLVMLWNLGMEVVGWAERNTAPADVLSVETMAISILMALYALMLVILGVATRTVINRVLGLGLMGTVVAKLYLSDIWELSRIFRIAAFLALGVTLLLVSYLYSRYKPAIERLWKDDVVS